VTVFVGRWNDRPDDSPDDWRGWKSGRYDNRYEKHNRRRRFSKNSYKKKQIKKIGIGIAIVLVIGIIGFLFVNGILEIDQENLEESIKNIPKNLPEIPYNIPSIPSEISKPLTDIVNKTSEVVSQVNTKIQNIATPQETTEEQAISAIEYINKLRAQNGKNPITHDSRVFQIALARVKDMYDYNYLDHTNPETGTCPYNIKSNYGLSAKENVAENAYGSSSISNPSLNKVVDGWMTSTGHRMNLLSYEHISGSVACYGGYCVFLGLNHGTYGEGCYTGAEGQEYAARFENCTPEQMQQYDALNIEYDKLPRMASSQAEYQRGMNLYNQIVNFKC